MNRNARFAATLAALAIAGATSAAAEWRWSITPYVWATDVGIDVSVDDRQIVDETISIQSSIEDLDTIAQVRFEAERSARPVRRPVRCQPVGRRDDGPASFRNGGGDVPPRDGDDHPRSRSDLRSAG
ncbi:MAG: hypothetical protein R2862_01210 [Thermoanaerobaculia bacterium]